MSVATAHVAPLIPSPKATYHRSPERAESYHAGAGAGNRRLAYGDLQTGRRLLV